MIELVYFSDKHAESLVRILNHPEIIKWVLTPPQPYLHEDALSYIGKCKENIKYGREFNFAIELKGRHIGGIVLKQEADNIQNAITGYHIEKKHWGNGYASTALKKVLHFGFYELKLKKISAFTFESNIASQKVLVKCGFLAVGSKQRVIKKGTAYHGLKYFSIENKEYKIENT